MLGPVDFGFALSFDICSNGMLCSVTLVLVGISGETSAPTVGETVGLTVWTNSGWFACAVFRLRTPLARDLRFFGVSGVTAADWGRFQLSGF